jgi:hypothetical protein
MNPSFPPNFNGRDKPNAATQAWRAEPLRDALGNAWSAADLAAAAERGVAYVARQVLPAFDPSDPGAGA